MDKKEKVRPCDHKMPCDFEKVSLLTPNWSATVTIKWQFQVLEVKLEMNNFGI